MQSSTVDVRVSPPAHSGMFLMPATNEEHRGVHPDVPPLTRQLQPSIFNLRVPLPERNEVFLMNTLTDAQLVVAPEVAGLLDRVVALDGRPTDLRRAFDSDEIDALQVLIGNGFLVRDRQADRRHARSVLCPRHQQHRRTARHACSPRCSAISPATTAIQGDHGDYNKFAEKMSMETAVRVGDWIERELDRVRPEKLHADVLRRRAAAEPAGRCTTSPSACGMRPRRAARQ